MLLSLTVDTSLILKDFFGGFSIPPIIEGLKSRSFFFRMVHNEKLFRNPSVKYPTFSDDPTWSDVFPYVFRKTEKIVAYMVKTWNSWSI